MDGLALLCNLHADGPLTLRRLRQAGIRSLTELERAPRESLAGILRISGHQAQRFLVEADLLKRRTELEWSEPLPAAPLKKIPSLSSSSSFGPASVVEACDLMGDAFGAVKPRPKAIRSTFKLPASARRPQCYDTVSDDDTTDGRGADAMLGVHAVVVTPAPTTTTKTTSATRPPRLPHEAVQGTLLRSGQIPGLDYRTLERLIANGIRTYRSLVDLASLTLARRAGLPYTKLLDLRYHAKHFLALRLFPKGMPAPAPVESAGFEQREIVLVPPPRVDRATLRSPSARTDRSYLIPPSPEVSVRSEDSTVPGVAGPFV